MTGSISLPDAADKLTALGTAVDDQTTSRG